MPLFIRATLLCLVLIAAAYDLRIRRIPNWLSASGIILGGGLNTLFSGFEGLRNASLGLGCAFAIYFMLYMLRAMGAGDVKLMAAVGALVGPVNWFSIFLATALIGGVVSLVVVLAKRRLAETLSNVMLISSELAHLRAPSKADSRYDVRHAQSLRLPHGAVIGAGCLLFLLATGFSSR